MYSYHMCNLLLWQATNQMITTAAAFHHRVSFVEIWSLFIILSCKEMWWSWTSNKHQEKKHAGSNKHCWKQWQGMKSSLQTATKWRWRGGKSWNLLCWITNPFLWNVGLQRLNISSLTHTAKLTFHLQSSCPTSVLQVSEFLKKHLEKANAVSISSNMKSNAIKKSQYSGWGYTTQHEI